MPIPVTAQLFSAEPRCSTFHIIAPHQYPPIGQSTRLIVAHLTKLSPVEFDITNARPSAVVTPNAPTPYVQQNRFLLMVAESYNGRNRAQITSSVFLKIP